MRGLYSPSYTCIQIRQVTVSPYKSQAIVILQAKHYKRERFIRTRRKLSSWTQSRKWTEKRPRGRRYGTYWADKGGKSCEINTAKPSSRSGTWKERLSRARARAGGKAENSTRRKAANRKWCALQREKRPTASGSLVLEKKGHEASSVLWG